MTSSEPRHRRCRIRKIGWNGKWACIVFNHGKPVECEHLTTWAEALRYQPRYPKDMP